jgi:hypothetical protein
MRQQMAVEGGQWRSMAAVAAAVVSMGSEENQATSMCSIGHGSKTGCKRSIEISERRT